jgi:hypothetical protein
MMPGGAPSALPQPPAQRTADASGWTIGGLPRALGRVIDVRHHAHVVSTIGLLTAALVLILAPLAVLYLPIWASLAAVGTVLLMLMLGGEALLLKALVLGGLLAGGGVYWRRRRERRAA